MLDPSGVSRINSVASLCGFEWLFLGCPMSHQSHVKWLLYVFLCGAEIYVFWTFVNHYIMCQFSGRANE